MQRGRTIVGDDWYGQRRLGFHEGVLDALGLEDLLYHVGRSGQCALDVATGIGRHRQHVAVQLPDGVLVGDHSHLRIAVDRQRHVLQFHQGSGPAGRLPVIGHHHGQYVAQIRGATSLRNHHWPVGVDDSYPTSPGDVCRRQHPVDSVDRLGRRGVDPDHVSPGVVGQPQCRVKEIVRKQVVDVVAVAEGQLVGLHLGHAGADPALGQRHRHLAGGQGLHGVEDLHVAGAPAQVGPHMAGRVVPPKHLAPVGRLVQQRLGPHEDARDAKAALQRAVGSKCLGIPDALVVREALHRGDQGPFGLFHRDLAGHSGLAVQQHSAATTLARR